MNKNESSGFFAIYIIILLITFMVVFNFWLGLGAFILFWLSLATTHAVCAAMDCNESSKKLLIMSGIMVFSSAVLAIFSTTVGFLYAYFVLMNSSFLTVFIANFFARNTNAD